MGLRVAFVLIAGLASAQSFPEGPGRETFQSVCSLCHSPTAVLTKAMTRDEWQTKVTEMLQEEEVPDSEREQIIEYLTRNFPKAGVTPKINVNKAAASQLSVALALAEKDAESIVRYRQEKGAFQTIDDLKKVPGLTADKIDAERDRVEF